MQLSRVIWSKILQHPASYTLFFKQQIEESIGQEKRMEVLEELDRRIQILEDSKSHQSFQIQYPYSIFRVPQQEEHTDFEKSTKFMIQFQNDPFNMIESRLNRLENMCRNKKTLPTQSLTTPNTSNHIDENQESWYLEDFDQDLISPQNLKLD